MSAKKIRGAVMKKHKIEFAGLALLLGVLCYAYFDCSITGKEQNIVLDNNLYTTVEVQSKDDITMEMLSLLNKELLIEEKKSDTEEEATYDGENIYSVNLAAVDNEIPYNEIISNQVINYALNFVGRPYVYGGNSLTNGTDCSGFTKLIYKKYGVSLPRSAREQSLSGKSVGLENIMPGDLVFSGYNGRICHVAIYMGNNKLVHALNANVGIVVTSLYVMPIIDVRRVI